LVAAKGNIRRKLPLDARRIEESVRTLERKPIGEPFGVGRNSGHDVTDELDYITSVNGVGEGDGARESFGDGVGNDLEGSRRGGQQK
jgi:hypothetical protein